MLYGLHAELSGASRRRHPYAGLRPLPAPQPVRLRLYLRDSKKEEIGSKNFCNFFCPRLSKGVAARFGYLTLLSPLWWFKKALLHRKVSAQPSGGTRRKR